MVLNTNAATTAVEENGTASTNVTSNIKHYHYHQQEQQQKKRQSIDNSMIRFPKLDECAHFHYEFAELQNFHVSLIINENCNGNVGRISKSNENENNGRGSTTPSPPLLSMNNDNDQCTNIRSLYLFVRVQSLGRSWTVRRNLQDFRFLDIQLHKCVFDRKHSMLQPFNLTYFSSFDSLDSIIHFVAQYLERLSQIVGGCFLTCGPVLHWFEIDNRAFASGRVGGRRRDQLKSSGILRERVFGCDLCEHLANSGNDLPLVLTTCCAYIEANGLNANGIYRLSGVASTINRLRAVFDEDRVPGELSDEPEVEMADEEMMVDIHAVSSLLKLYFRELPNPLLTFSLYESFVTAMRDDSLDGNGRLHAIRSLVISLPPPHWRTLRYLIRHLSYVSTFDAKTGMTPKNLAIVWAPNLLRSRDLEQHVGIEALHVIGTQAVLTEFLILNCDKIFDREEHEIHPPKPLYSPFINGKHANGHVSSKCLKYIDVGPEIIPGKYHTIISTRPSVQSKRSKFNIQNWKKFHFFSTRSHNNRSRPSLFGDDKHCVNVSGTFRKLNSNFDGTSSESTNNFNPYLKPGNNRFSIRSGKSVKRSQSFDSYFKKLRANISNNNNNNNVTNCMNKTCIGNEDPFEDEHDVDDVDINRNKFTHNKNDTIFEVEEMAIDCDNHLPQNPISNIDEVNKLESDLMSNDKKPELGNNNHSPMIDTVDTITTEFGGGDQCTKGDIMKQLVEATQLVTSFDQSNQVQQMDTNCSVSNCEMDLPNGRDTKASITIDDRQCSLGSRFENDIRPSSSSTESASTSTSPTLSDGQSTSTRTSCELIDTHHNHHSSIHPQPHSPSLSSTSSATSEHHSTETTCSDVRSPILPVCSIENGNECSPTRTTPSPSTEIAVNPELATDNCLIGSAELHHNPSSSASSPSHTIQSCSTHSSLNSLPINESNLAAHSNELDDDNVQSIDNNESTKTSSSEISISTSTPPPTTEVATIWTISPNSTFRDSMFKFNDLSERERIERIKQERRSQIRQNFVQHMKSNDPTPPSRIPVSLRSNASALPEISNSSDSSPIRMRPKPVFNNYRNQWRNSDASMVDQTNVSVNTNSVNANKPNITEYRRSVPNLEAQIQTINTRYNRNIEPINSTTTTKSDKMSPINNNISVSLQRTGSLTNSVKLRRPKVTQSISVQEGTTMNNSNGGSGVSSTMRTKIAVTPLRTINTKRQRVIDPKMLAQMFEQQNAVDKV
ncbi:hypothetical protein RDWZM_002097 [Blomia tropicalis]|uniref:Rho-GAP domain-containing protein n=1 Tax=Blomia tropicalis TaxID=40697 RepID=A0A9Q0MDE6_BLOTA|nr:hypothetical protein RDWZM_002097 [Blomia tropicalis]